MMQRKMLLVLGCVGFASASTSNVGLWTYVSEECDTVEYTDADGAIHSNCGSNQVATPGRCSTSEKPAKHTCRIPGCHETETSVDVCDVKVRTGGNELNPAPSPATSSIRSTRILDPMRGFKDMKDSRFLKFPSTMIGRDALVPSVRTKAGYDVTLECIEGNSGVGGFCDHFVVLYSCPPCEHANGGNLAAVLLADGWVPHRCGTVMDFDANLPSHLHQMVIYHKQTKEGPPLMPGSDSIVPSALLEFAFFANTPATSYCPSITDETECKDHLPAECAWKDGMCVADLCPKSYKPHGPWSAPPKCGVCPHDASEEVFLPALKI